MLAVPAYLATLAAPCEELVGSTYPLVKKWAVKERLIGLQASIPSEG